MKRILFLLLLVSQFASAQTTPTFWKPSDVAGNYSPIGHLHAISDVTSLQAALNGKEPALTLGTALQYYKGDKTLATFPTSLSSFTNEPGFLTNTTGDARYSLLSHTHAYSSLTGIPSTFTPATHSHVIADVTNLQTTLNGKEPTITAGTTLQYLRGDKSLATFPTAVTSFTNDAGYLTTTTGDLRYSLLAHTHTYASLTGVPTTFTPAAHVHVIADVTSLQTTLNGKEPTITAGTTAQYLRGDKSLATFPTAISSFTNDAGFLTNTTGDARYSLLAHTHAYSALTGVPSTFAPSAHTHAESEITNLVTDLAGKASTSHTHAYSSLTSIPATFAPSAHTHAESEVTNLVTDLAGKAATVHTHAESDITNLVTDLAAKATLASYNMFRTVAEATGSHTAARVAGTYWLGQGDPIGISGTGTLYPPNLISITAADYPTTDGKTAKLRLRVIVSVNDVAPTGNYTFGLYPVTRPATSGGAGLDIYTLGTVVTGSTVLFTAPAADAMTTSVSTEFTLPADGIYVIGVVSTAAVATSSHLHLNATLQTRNQ